MSTAPTRSGAAVAGWVLFAVLCVTLDISGVVDGLALPMPLLVDRRYSPRP